MAVENRRFFTSFFGSEQLDSLANPPKSEYELQTAKSIPSFLMCRTVGTDAAFLASNQ